MALVCAASLGRSLSLNFRHCTDDREPYVFVQRAASFADYFPGRRPELRPRG